MLECCAQGLLLQLLFAAYGTHLLALAGLMQQQLGCGVPVQRVHVVVGVFQLLALHLAVLTCAL